MSYPTIAVLIQFLYLQPSCFVASQAVQMSARCPVAPHDRKPPAADLLPKQLQDARLPWFNGSEGLILAGGAVTSMVVQSLSPQTLQCCQT